MPSRTPIEHGGKVRQSGMNLRRGSVVTLRNNGVGLIALGLAAALVVGCASRKPEVEVGTKTVPMDESFDVESLGLEEIPIPAAEKVHHPRRDSLARAQEGAGTAGAAEDELVPGYRVQICATPDEQTARSYLHEAILKFLDQGVYLTFDSPYYKVRVGDCKSRYEAEELQQLVEKAGFSDAWVVKTRVLASPQLQRGKSEEEPEPEQP